MSNTIELYYLREVTYPYGASEYGEVIDSPYFVSEQAAREWAYAHGFMHSHYREPEFAVQSVEVSAVETD